MTMSSVAPILLFAHIVLAQCTIQSPLAASAVGSRDASVTVRAAPTISLVLTVTDQRGTVRSAQSHLHADQNTGLLTRWVRFFEGLNTIRVEDESDASQYCAVTVTRTANSKNYPDDRDDFDVSAYLGLAIDTFTASQFRDIVYNNPTESGAKHERLIGGYDFGYRLKGNPHDPWKSQLWIYGQTAHGVRSAEVNCSGAQSQPPVCGLKQNPLNPLNNPALQLMYLLRNASSMEGSLGLRYEFLPLQIGGRHPARLYVKGQLGFLAIPASGAGAFQVHHLGLGAVSTAGGFAGSFLEAGYGRNDVFVSNRYRRFKFSGLLTWHAGSFETLGIKPFVQLFVDSDLSRGAASVQTFLGLSFDLSKVFE
jgi:hypothetical protein